MIIFLMTALNQPSPLAGEGVMQSMTEEGPGAASQMFDRECADRAPSSERFDFKPRTIRRYAPSTFSGKGRRLNVLGPS